MRQFVFKVVFDAIHKDGTGKHSEWTYCVAKDFKDAVSKCDKASDGTVSTLYLRSITKLESQSVIV